MDILGIYHLNIRKISVFFYHLLLDDDLCSPSLEIGQNLLSLHKGNKHQVETKIIKSFLFINIHPFIPQLKHMDNFFKPVIKHGVLKHEHRVINFR